MYVGLLGDSGLILALRHNALAKQAVACPRGISKACQTLEAPGKCYEPAVRCCCLSLAFGHTSLQQAPSASCFGSWSGISPLLNGCRAQLAPVEADEGVVAAC